MKKNKNIILYSTISVVALALIVWFVNAATNKPEPMAYSQGRISIEESNFDFGTINMNNGNVTHEFRLANDSSEVVKIQKAYTSCMCTTAFITDNAGIRYGAFGMAGHGLQNNIDVELTPGETMMLEAVFDPAAHGPSGVGLAQRYVYLETNSAKSPKLEISFQAMVTR